MANLYLTHRCQRGCPFCFARKVLKEGGNRLDEVMTIDEVRTLLDRFGAAMNPIGLLGGEPFLYPHLTELLALLRERNILAKVFTSATNPMPEALQDLSLEDATGGVNFVVNVGTRDTYSDRQFANLEAFFHKFASLSSLSFTIFDLQGDATYLFDLIDRYHLNRNIRVGIALPILKGGNQYIPLEQYREAGEYYVRVALAAAERQITLSMDCGFQACMFTTEQLGVLQLLGTHLNFVCGSAIDIGPKLQAWNCFPLFQIGRVDVMKAKNAGELQDMLREACEAALGDAPGVRPECAECDLRKKDLCKGGCKSFKSV